MKDEPRDILMQIFPDRPRVATADDTPPPDGWPNDPGMIIDALLDRLGDQWNVIVHLAHDVLLELESDDDEAAYDREKPRLRALIEWAWKHHESEVIRQQAEADRARRAGTAEK